MCNKINNAMNFFELDVQKLNEIEEICQKYNLKTTQYKILVNVDKQRLHLIESEQLIHSYVISTARNGTGQKKDTGKTPLGLHFVHSKIGDKAGPLEIFRGRVATGTLAIEDEGEKLIVGRILWLQGAQSGFNQGKDLTGNVVDTYQRYIYIHGTNDIAGLGSPVSEGCIRMKPKDVIELFQQVTEGTPVYIYQT